MKEVNNSKSLNNFTLEVEEMYCTECVNVTGHLHTGKYMTCIICGNQQGKKIRFFKRLKDSLTLAIFKRKNDLSSRD